MGESKEALWRMRAFAVRIHRRLYCLAIPGPQMRGISTPRTKTRCAGPGPGAPSVLTDLRPGIWDTRLWREREQRAEIGRQRQGCGERRFTHYLRSDWGQNPVLNRVRMGDTENQRKFDAMTLRKALACAFAGVLCFLQFPAGRAQLVTLQEMGRDQFVQVHMDTTGEATVSAWSRNGGGELTRLLPQILHCQGSLKADETGNAVRCSRALRATALRSKPCSTLHRSRES